MSVDEIHNLDIRLTKVEESLSHMATDLSSISSGINRLLWLIAAGFVGSGVAWVIQGGLMV